MLHELNLEGKLQDPHIVYDVLGAEKGVAEMMTGVFAAAADIPMNITVVGPRNEINQAITDIKKTRKFEVIAPRLYRERFDTLTSRIYIVHAEHAATGNTPGEEVFADFRSESPRFSINLATKFARDTNAIGVISPGATGATVASARAAFKKLKIGGNAYTGSPPIATPIPTKFGIKLLLDIGANKQFKPQHLFYYGILGSAFYQAIQDDGTIPKIGLLNIGTEEEKGKSEIKEAHALFKNSSIKDHYVGFVEPKDLFFSPTEIIVTDGEKGNIALKFMETTAKHLEKTIGELGKKAHFLPGALYLYVVGFRGRMMKDMKDSEYGGAIMPGLDHLVMVSHGSADSRAARTAINRLYRSRELIPRMKEILAGYSTH